MDRYWLVRVLLGSTHNYMRRYEKRQPSHLHTTDPARPTLCSIKFGNSLKIIIRSILGMEEEYKKILRTVVVDVIYIMRTLFSQTCLRNKVRKYIREPGGGENIRWHKAAQRPCPPLLESQ